MGELLSLMTALLWAFGVVLFKKSVSFVPPFALSVFKAIIAFVLMAATTVVVGQAHAISISPAYLMIILFSGALGIGISDTLYLMTLSRIGASRTALVDCLYSPFVILFSAFMLDEKLSRLAVVGGVLILSSVLISSNRGFEKRIPPKQLWTGCVLGGSAMGTVGFCNRARETFAAALSARLDQRYPIGRWTRSARAPAAAASGPSRGDCGFSAAVGLGMDARGDVLRIISVADVLARRFQILASRDRSVGKIRRSSPLRQRHSTIAIAEAVKEAFNAAGGC